MAFTTAVDPVTLHLDVLIRQLKALGDPITGAEYLREVLNFNWTVRVGFQILNKPYYCAYEISGEALREVKAGDTRLIKHIYDYFMSMIRDRTYEVFNA